MPVQHDRAFPHPNGLSGLTNLYCVQLGHSGLPIYGGVEVARADVAYALRARAMTEDATDDGWYMLNLDEDYTDGFTEVWVLAHGGEPQSTDPRLGVYNFNLLNGQIVEFEEIMATLEDIEERTQYIIDNAATSDDVAALTVAMAELQETLEEVGAGLGTGGGDRTVTFTVVDADTMGPVAGAIVTLLSAGSVVAWGPTSSNGIVVLGANDGSYTYRVTGDIRYEGVFDVALTVNSDEAVGVELTPHATTPPESLDQCVVSGTLLDGSGVAVPNRVVSATMVRPPQGGATTLVETQAEKAVTNTSGIYRFTLLRGHQYRVQLPEAGVNRVITVPDEESADMNELLGVS